MEEATLSLAVCLITHRGKVTYVNPPNTPPFLTNMEETPVHLYERLGISIVYLLFNAKPPIIKIYNK